MKQDCLVLKNIKGVSLMKYQEGFVGSKNDFADFIKKMVPQLFSSRLVVEGTEVTVPSDRDLDYKMKYDTDEAGGSFTLKVSWDNAPDVEVNTEED
jgi:hypothetical protein